MAAVESRRRWTTTLRNDHLHQWLGAQEEMGTLLCINFGGKGEGRCARGGASGHRVGTCGLGTGVSMYMSRV